jgi:hypothetical protein
MKVFLKYFNVQFTNQLTEFWTTCISTLQGGGLHISVEK